MISLKRFMGWVTASNNIPSQVFQSLRWCLPLSWRLWLVYLTAMSALFGVSLTVVYFSFTRSLNELLDQELLTLAQAAAPSLETVKAEGLQDFHKNLPWHSLFEREQGLEWFNAEGKLLAREGTTFPNFSLAKYISPLHLKRGSPLLQQQGEIRTLTISVFSENSQPKTLRLEGYIRASESTQETEAALRKFQLGLGLGGIMALILSSITSIWLSRMALEPIQQSFQQLKQFTADASHELRTPLTAIYTANEVMRSHPERIHPLDAKKLVAIASATDQLTRLANNLLFLARTDSETVPLDRQWISVPLDELLQNLVEFFEPQAQAKGISITSHLLEGIAVKGNPEQLARLFSNLLENALKYTLPTGSVVLRLAKHKEFVIITLKDTGIGIASEHLPFIFQRFWRADKARSQQVEGSGLGLAIAQMIAYQHGGKITVTSQIGTGSCFQVYLPRV